MIRIAQLLLIVSAAGLWAASRLSWVSVRSADGLGQPKTSEVIGATWSNALLPLAVLLLAAALVALAVRGLRLRALAIQVAAVCLVLGYLGVSLMVMPDVAPRAAALAGVPIITLVGSERHAGGAILTVAAAVCTLLAAALLMRGAASAHGVAKYSGPAAGRGETGATTSSGRGMWDALDDGRDPTDVDADTEGR